MKNSENRNEFRRMRGWLRVVEGILLFAIIILVITRMVEKGVGKDVKEVSEPNETKTLITNLEKQISTTVECGGAEEPHITTETTSGMNTEKPTTDSLTEGPTVSPAEITTIPTETPAFIEITLIPVETTSPEPIETADGKGNEPLTPETTITMIADVTTSPKPTATLTVKPTVTPTPKPVATLTIKPTATSTPKPTSTLKPTSTPTTKPTTRPTAKPTSTPTATSTPKPTSTPPTKPTATPTLKPTSTPTATPTPKPTTTPTISTEGTLTRRTDIEAILMKKINDYRKSMGIGAWEDPYAFDFVTESGVQIGDYLYGKVMPVAQRNAKEKSAEHSPGQMGAFTEAFPTDTAEEVADILFNLWKNSPAHNAQMLSDWRYPNGDGTYVFEERANIAVLVVYQYAKGYYYDTYAAVWMDTAAQESQRR